MSGFALIRRSVQLKLSQGLHIRACSKVVAIVGNFNGQVHIRYGSRTADASSMFDLVQLAALPGADLLLEGSGDGVEEILDRLEHLLSQTTEPAE